MCWDSRCSRRHPATERHLHGRSGCFRCTRTQEWRASVISRSSRAKGGCSWCWRDGHCRSEHRQLRLAEPSSAHVSCASSEYHAESDAEAWPTAARFRRSRASLQPGRRRGLYWERPRLSQQRALFLDRGVTGGGVLPTPGAPSGRLHPSISHVTVPLTRFIWLATRLCPLLLAPNWLGTASLDCYSYSLIAYK